MNYVEKIKELVAEIEKNPGLSFKETLVENAVSVATNVGLLTSDDFSGKSVDEKLAVLKQLA